MRSFFIAAFAICLLASCKGKKKDKAPENPVEVTDTVQVINTPDPVNDSMLREQTHEAMLAFKNKDLNALAAMVHPDSGVRFSPYAYINTATDKVVTADWIRTQTTKKEKIMWGVVDPTGDPINLSLAAYIDRYVYDVDFIRPESLKVNEAIGAGNTTNNLKEIYPTCNFTESHFPGFDKRHEGMDWRSLRLVFKMKDGKYYLVGVIHDEWTM